MGLGRRHDEGENEKMRVAFIVHLSGAQNDRLHRWAAQVPFKRQRKRQQKLYEARVSRTQ